MNKILEAFLASFEYDILNKTFANYYKSKFIYYFGTIK